MNFGVTMRLANFIHELEYNRLPINTINKVKESLLDYIGVVLAGCKDRSVLSEKITELIIQNGGLDEATIIGYKSKVPLINAVLCNGVTSHVVELDDGHRDAKGHPGVSVISAALAAAEYSGSDGKNLITAIVAGYDIFVRIASSVNPSHLNRGFHTTGTCGTFAAAAATAKVLKLNTEEIANALGLAGIQSAGLLEVTIDGQMAKALHPGKSAQAGILAALLAGKGVQGPKTVIEGVKGFAKSMSDECDYKKMLKDLNEYFHIDNCYIKLYPSCRHTHSPVDAVLDLIDENDFDFTEIDDILIKTYPTAISFAGSIFKPETPEAAKFSIAYCVCAALVNGKFGLQELEPEYLRNPSILDLTEKTRIESDPRLESLSPKRKGAEVIITVRDGRKLRKRVNLPKGEVENPVTYEELIKKFNYCTSGYFRTVKREQVIEHVFSIENSDNIADFVSLFF